MFQRNMPVPAQVQASVDRQCDSNFQVHPEIMGSNGFHKIGLKMQMSFSPSKPPMYICGGGGGVPKSSKNTESKNLEIVALLLKINK